MAATNWGHVHRTNHLKKNYPDLWKRYWEHRKARRDQYRSSGRKVRLRHVVTIYWSSVWGYAAKEGSRPMDIYLHLYDPDKVPGLWERTGEDATYAFEQASDAMLFKLLFGDAPPIP